MEPAKDNGKKNEKKEESSENEIKEVKSELKEQRLDQIRRFEELLNGVKLSQDEKESLRNLIESAKSGTGANDIFERIKALMTQLKESEEKRPRLQERKLQQVAALIDTHDFWDTQPVPKSSDLVTDTDFDKPIEGPRKPEEERQEPLALPANFYWADVDLADDAQAKEVYELLVANYVEDSDNTLRFDYSVDFLRWALTPPGFKKNWLLGVRGGKKNKLFGFISGVPVQMSVNGKAMMMAEINFLCVHKSLRTKKLSPVLIKEVTRRVHLDNIWQAIYTAGVMIPTPISQATYYHRGIDVKKLIECEFSMLPLNVSMAKHVKKYNLPKNTDVAGLREMTKADVPQVTKLLNEYLSQFSLHIIFSQEEVEHFITPRDGVMYAFVAENAAGTITDLISFYGLPSTVLNNSGHDRLNAAYCYYVVPGQHSMKDLMYNALILAKQRGFDVFNALDIMTNDTQMFEELKFNMGDGNLNFYLYNWRVRKLPVNQIGITLV